MSVIELTPEQERALREEGVVELPDVVVMTPAAYRVTRRPRTHPSLLPDPPLEPVEVDPPFEIPMTGERFPVDVTLREGSVIVPDPPWIME